MADKPSLPPGVVRRLVKTHLAQLAAAGGGGEDKKEVVVQKDALGALAASSEIFIHFLTDSANALCHDAKRQTVSAEDVLKALEEADLGDYVGPLRESLAGACAGELSGGRGGARSPFPPMRSFSSPPRAAFKASAASKGKRKAEAAPTGGEGGEGAPAEEAAEEVEEAEEAEEAEEVVEAEK